MVQRKKCKTRATLKNDALDAKIDVDTAEKEPRKGSEILKNRKNGRPNYQGSDSITRGFLPSYGREQAGTGEETQWRSGPTPAKQS